MLTSEENELLTRIGPGTPGGELLRRYWHVVAAASEITEEKPKKESGSSAKIWCCIETAAASMDLSPSTAPTAACLFTTDLSRRTASAAPITAGSTTPAAS